MQTSDNKMKTLTDFKNLIASQLGYDNWESVYWYQVDEINGMPINNQYAKEKALLLAANMLSVYAFEEGCKAQRREMAEQHLLYYLSENPHEENVAKEESKYPLAHNPFSSPQNNEQ